MTPIVQSFFDAQTYTYSYVVQDPSTDNCAIIDSVLDYDPATGKTSTINADKIITWIRDKGLNVEWILDTHIHADHLSAMQYLKRELGGETAIGEDVGSVQETFGSLFNAESGFSLKGDQFDRLFSDGCRFRIGNLSARALHTPGHTPACVTYVFNSVAFVGDTLFMPDYGTARTDFPGGDAAALYLSIKRIFALPEDTILYLCHDYGTATRDKLCNQTTVAEQRSNNIHIRDGVSAAEFVVCRESRDADLAAPRLLLPSVQYNMRAGHLPPAESNGTHYLKIPVRNQ